MQQDLYSVVIFSRSIGSGLSLVTIYSHVMFSPPPRSTFSAGTFGRFSSKRKKRRERISPDRQQWRRQVLQSPFRTSQFTRRPQGPLIWKTMKNSRQTLKLEPRNADDSLNLKITTTTTATKMKMKTQRKKRSQHQHHFRHSPV